jgi:hypothetical protein
VLSCEFDTCGTGASPFQAGAAAIGGTIACQFLEPCGAIEDSLLVLSTVGVVGYDIYQMSKGGKQNGKQNIVPSWAEGSRPLPGESASEFAERLCKAQYRPPQEPDLA